MKKFLRQIVLVVFGISTGYAVIIYGLHKSGSRITNLDKYVLEKGHLYHRLSEADTTADVDVLFLGSSHAYRGFDPRIFKETGLSSFNLGSSAQTPSQTLLLVDKYLYKLNPKLIILEVSPLFFKYLGQESTLDFIRNLPSTQFKLKFLWKGLDVFNFNSFLVSEIDQLVSGEKVFSTCCPTDTYVSGGFVERAITYNKPSAFKKKKETKLLESQFENYHELISLFETSKIKYLLVQAPVTTQYYNMYNQEEFEVALKGEHFYLDFNKMIELNDSLDFYDSNHLNQHGVRKFNRILIEKIRERRLINF